MVMPCNVLLDENDTIAPECIPDLDEQKKYLGPFNVLLLHNNQEFRQDGFGSESIRHESVISK